MNTSILFRPYRDPYIDPLGYLYGHLTVSLYDPSNGSIYGPYPIQIIPPHMTYRIHITQTMPSPYINPF